jgi:hypothetical protein
MTDWNILEEEPYHTFFKKILKEFEFTKDINNRINDIIYNLNINNIILININYFSYQFKEII